MPKVYYYYSKCKGLGNCVEACPIDILEMSADEKWGKPVDGEVDNQDALEQYYEKVEGKNDADLTLEFDLHECIQCMACVVSCTADAIKVEL